MAEKNSKSKVATELTDEKSPVIKNKNDNNTCFVIMPIGEGEKYSHFKRVYDQIFTPAIEKAGYIPKRADDEKGSKMIHVNIIKEIVTAPMAICDLSTKNPNVLFELGLRQAFDLPVVLVQEKGTERIFDISTINTIDYRKERIYDEVLEDRKNITEAIMDTADKTRGINSIIKLLSIQPAGLKTDNELSDSQETMLLYSSILNEVRRMNIQMEEVRHDIYSQNRMDGSIRIRPYDKEIIRKPMEQVRVNLKKEEYNTAGEKK